VDSLKRRQSSSSSFIIVLPSGLQLLRLPDSVADFTTVGASASFIASTVVSSFMVSLRVVVGKGNLGTLALLLW